MAICTNFEINLSENNGEDLAAEYFCKKFLQKTIIPHDVADNIGKTLKINNNQNFI